MRAALPLRPSRLTAPVVAAASVDWIRVLRALVFAAAAVHIAVFLIAAALRLSYPFALQLTEPASLRQVERILHGEAIYVEPTLRFVPMIYGPVSFYLAAAAALVVGPTYTSLRLVSLLASLVSLVLIGRLVQRETGSSWAGVIGAGLYAAAFPFSQTALDLGRVDALFVCCLIGALYCARRAAFVPEQAGRSLVVSGALVGVAGLTKLPLGAIPIGAAILGYLILAQRRQIVPFVLGLVVVLAVGYTALRWQTGAWGSWYLWDLPRLHELRQDLIGRFWFIDLLPRFAVCLLIGPVFVLTRLLHGDWRPFVFYGATMPSMLVLAWISRSNAGGAMNVLLPAFAVAAMLLGLGLHAAVQQLADPSRRARVFQGYVLGLALLQFALLIYNARLTVPYRSDQWADERLAARLAALPGPIFAPDLDGYMHDQVDDLHPMLGPLQEIQGSFGGDGTAEGRRVGNELAQAVAEHRFQYIVIVDGDCCLPGLAVARGYRNAGPLFPPDDVFYELKSSRTPEQHIFVAPGAPDPPAP